MQFTKEEIKRKILAAAREEFLQRGFEKASIRNITAAAQTSKSNIYNYFKDKDALFYAVVEPTLRDVQKGLEVVVKQNAAGTARTYTMEAQKHYIQLVMNFVFENAEDFRLLLFCSAGSSLESFKTKVIDDFAGVLAGWYSRAMPDKPLTVFFIRCIAGFYANTIEQLLRMDVSKQQAGEHFDEFLKFVYGGWRGVMQ